ncbi:YdcF family protein [Candidatus Woesearchaeota archaeon]|nr:YdcF family protein [Candidatus Woesearchaeota archaeon]
MHYRSVKTHIQKRGIDCIIVLGGGFRGGKLSFESKKRVEAGANLYEQGFSNTLLMSGGFTVDTLKKSEGGEMKKFAVELGVKPNNIFIEEESLDTIGNAIFSKPIIKKKNFKNLLLVTSDYHLERSLFIFHYVFGSGFSILGFDVLTSFVRKFVQQKEKKERDYLLEVQAFFSGIKRGNDKAILKRMKEVHPYYKKNSKEKGDKSWFVQLLKRILG